MASTLARRFLQLLKSALDPAGRHQVADQHHLFGITPDTNSFLAKFQSPFVRGGTSRTMHTRRFAPVSRARGRLNRTSVPIFAGD